MSQQKQWYYHGTSEARRKSIYMHSAFMVLPVYLTTDRARAEHYAMARAAHDGDSHYAIIGLNLAPHRVQADDYSEHEPGQYKLTRPLHQNTVYSANLKHDTFPMPTDQAELIRLKAFCVSMGWGEERSLAPQFKHLLKEKEYEERDA